jgi:hypothetical protein
MRSNPSKVWEDLTELQADGLACIVCDTNYMQVAIPHLPVGRSTTGSQVFACRSCLDTSPSITEVH